MKDDWKTVKLGEVCTIRPPKKEAKEKLSDDEMVSFVPMNNLNIRSKELTLEESKPLKKVSGSYTYFADGDVLLAKITPCFENGKLGIATGLVNGVGFGSSEFMVFRTKGNVLPDYLYCYFSQASFREEGKRVMSGAVGHKRVPKEFIEEYPLPLPPLPEQERIVAILDKAFEGIDQAIAHTEQNLASARELFESYLNNIFTQRGDDWVEKKLGDVYDVRDGTHDSPKYQIEGRALITSKNLKQDGLNFDKVKFIGEEDYLNIIKRSSVKKGDVLFAMIGTIGNPVVIEIEPDFAIKNVALFKMIDDQLGDFLKYYLRTRFVIDKMSKEAKGTTQRFVGLGYLRNFPISIPPVCVQESRVAEIKLYESKTQQLEALYTKKLESLKELKQSLLQRAFAGELTKEVIA